MTARTVQSLSDPAATVQEAAQVAVFADARALAGSGTQTFAPMLATQSTAAQAPAAPRDVFTAVANVVSGALNWVLNPLAGNAPGGPAQPPLIWGLLAFARREFDRFFAALAGNSTAATAAPAPTSVTAWTEPMARFALASSTIAAPEPTYVSPPAPFGKDVSTSTEFVGWVTGPYMWSNPADPKDPNANCRPTR